MPRKGQRRGGLTSVLWIRASAVASARVVSVVVKVDVRWWLVEGQTVSSGCGKYSVENLWVVWTEN